MTEINFNPIKLTQALVKCQSITPNDDGALLIVQDHLSSLGLNCTPLTFTGNESYEVKNLLSSQPLLKFPSIQPISSKMKTRAQSATSLPGHNFAIGYLFQ